MIIHKKANKKVALLVLAGWADTEKLDLVRINAVAGGIGNLCGHFIEQADFRVGNLLTPGADQVRVRIRLVAIVVIATSCKADLENLVNLFQQVDRLVNGCQAGRGKVDFDMLVDLLDARVLVALEKSLEDGNSLGCYPEITLAKLCQNFIETGLLVSHIQSSGLDLKE